MRSKCNLLKEKFLDIIIKFLITFFVLIFLWGFLLFLLFIAVVVVSFWGGDPEVIINFRLINILHIALIGLNVILFSLEFHSTKKLK